MVSFIDHLTQLADNSHTASHTARPHPSIHRHTHSTHRRSGGTCIRPTYIPPSVSHSVMTSCIMNSSSSSQLQDSFNQAEAITSSSGASSPTPVSMSSSLAESCVALVDGGLGGGVAVDFVPRQRRSSCETPPPARHHPEEPPPPAEGSPSEGGISSLAAAAASARTAVSKPL